MATLAKHIIVAGAKNRIPMLEKSMYDSWASRIRLFIKGKNHGRMMLDSIYNDLLVYPTVEENGQTRPKKYTELTKAQQLQDDCDVQATHIILHVLSPNVYALVNHQEAAKDIWDRVKMLMKGTELSYQERKCRLYNLFDKFANVPGETLYEYYWIFSQLINDMHTIRMTMQQVQVNTKFLNALPSEWSKSITDVKYQDSLAFVANSPTLYNPSQSPQHSGEYLTECINKAMAFLSAVASRFPPLNNQLRTSSNPRNQATIQDGEGHIARQCTQPKRPRNAAWFKEKLMLAEAQEVDDLDAYDLDCDDLSSAKAVLMANLSSCDPEVLYEIHSDSNIISYSQYLQETQDAVIQDTNPSEPNDLLVLSLVEQMTDHVAHLDKKNQTNKKVNESLTVELERKYNVENVKKDIHEIKTINIELEHSVAKLLSENDNLRIEREHLKSIYKEQFDSIRKTRVQSKEHCDSLNSQINSKSLENSDLNVQLQEKVFAITALKNELRKLKGKNDVNTMVSKPNATLAPGIEKLVAVILSNKDKRVRFAKPVTSSNNIPKQTDSLCQGYKTPFWGVLVDQRTKDESLWFSILSIDDLGLDWIYAHNFLTCLQQLSSYTFGHCEVSESATCLEKASFSCTSGHVEVPESASHLSSLKFSYPNTSALMIQNTNRRAYVKEEIVEGSNALNETGNVQRTLRTSSSGNTSTIQCYNCSGKRHYARNYTKPRVRESKYFMEQMLLAKQDEAGVIFTDEQNYFLFVDASRMEEIEELSSNICLMVRIQPADNTSDPGPSYDSAFISKVQSSSNNKNEEQMYPTHIKIINSTIGDDQIDSDIIFDSPNGNVNSGSIEKDTHVPDLCVLEQLARNVYQEAEKQQIFAQKVQKQNKTLTSQLELYKERVRVTPPKMCRSGNISGGVTS
ncbi:hypothetical protein Tco_0289642 [Tanacetum coccineum]